MLLKPEEITEPVLLIRIPRLFRAGMSPEELYDATRGVWKVAIERCRRARYALSIANGVVQEVYEVQSWHPANTTGYASGRVIEMPRYAGRWEFVGRVAASAIRDKYLGRPMQFAYGSMSPVLYLNTDDDHLLPRPATGVARDFRLQLQAARENALKDAEAFEGIIHVVERLGSFCLGRVGDLGKYQTIVEEVASYSPLASELPSQWRNVHTPFSLLYDIVRNARNDAMHSGVSARHLTTHAIELALILEDALRMSEDGKYISDYMVRDPVCAHLWQPVSFVRQHMLTNSFSYLSVKDGNQWYLVSDLEVAKYLQDPAERKARLATPLGEATEITLIQATCLSDKTPVDAALMSMNGTPILAFRDDTFAELTGILTAFDLL